MQMTIGSVLKVSVRHTFIRRGVFYYQRRVPRDLLDKYPSALIKRNLETADTIVAARKVSELDRHYEAEWTLLRADPASSPQATRVQAERLLAEHGIDPKNPGDELDHFFAKLDVKREKFAGGDDDKHRDAEPREFLSPVEVAALEIVQNPDKDRLSDALRFYLETHHKGDSATVKKAATTALNGLVAAVGDKVVDDLSRDDGRTYIKTELAREVKTTTVRRRLKALNAILNHYFTEKEIDRKNPLAALKIAGEGRDAEEREPFTKEELKTLQTKCREADDGPRWLLAMLSDTGARLAEVGGLTLDDIKLDADIPHLVFEDRPWRLVKTDGSERKVPLTGLALWAARRVKETAAAGQTLAFPRYIKDGAFNTSAASATLSKWLSSRGLDHTAHELRHTLRDRLRKVQCSEEIIDAIGGWAKKTVGQGYGKGYDLEIKLEWLQRITSE